MASDTRAYLTPPEVARLIRVRESKVISWIRAGRLPAINVSEGTRPKYRIKPDDLETFLASRAVAPISRPARRERLSVPRYV